MPVHDKTTYFSELVPSSHLLNDENWAVLSLFEILRLGGQNVEDEICRYSPKSVHTKARDVVRNLPKWRVVAEANAHFAPVPQFAMDVYAFVMEQARAVLDVLDPLLKAEQSDTATRYWEVLFENLKWCVKRLNGELVSDQLPPFMIQQTSQ